MRRKATTLLGGAALVTVLVLSGCVSSSGGNDSGSAQDLSKVTYKGTITMVNKFSDPTTSKFFPAMAKAFEKLHPGVTVNVQQTSDQAYKDKIKVLASSNSIPDIYFTWAGSYAKQFIDAGLAVNLTSQIGPGTAWGKTLAPSAVKAGEYGGKYYGIPIDLDAKFMLYNKKIFADNGVSVPTSLDGLLNTCKTLESKGIDPVAFGNLYGWPALHYVTQLNAYNVPAATLNADYYAKHGTFTNSGYVKSLQQFKTILDSCVVNGSKTDGVNDTDAMASFNTAKAAMYYDEWVGFGQITGQIAKDGWGIFKLPSAAGSSGDTGTLAGAPDLFLINSKSKNAPLAVAFMKFVVSKKNAQIQQTVMTGYPSPVLGSLTANNASPQSIDALKAVNSASGLAIWLDTVTPAPVASAFLAGGEALINGSQSPQQVMKSVQQAAKSGGE